MKKFLIALIILLALGGTAFFFGWVQMKVPPGSFGVVRSKTHGVLTESLKDGQFTWLWYALIPTNVEVMVFDARPLNQNLNLSGVLPSGETYQRFAGLTEGFDYEIKGVLSFTIDGDALPGLVQSENINDQAALDAYEQRIAGDIASLVVQKLTNAAGTPDTLEAIMESAQAGAIVQEVSAAYPALKNLSLSLQSVHFPDFALYRQSKSLYEAYLDFQKQSMQTALAAEAEQRVNAQARFDELAQYGELLEKYPVLLEYLKLEENTGNVTLSN
jgi:hypothetical protein